MLQGLETGHATLGVVGTVSRLLVPMVVAEMRKSAPGLSLRLTEGASERLAGEVAEPQPCGGVPPEPGAPPPPARRAPAGRGAGRALPLFSTPRRAGADRAGRA